MLMNMLSIYKILYMYDMISPLDQPIGPQKECQSTPAFNSYFRVFIIGVTQWMLCTDPLCDHFPLTSHWSTLKNTQIHLAHGKENLLLFIGQ